MRTVSPAIFLCLLSILFFACKSETDGGLQYSGVNTLDWVQASVYDKTTKKGVMWFQLFDKANDQSVLARYKNATEKVDDYPATIFSNKHVWVLVKNRFEIRLMADDASPDYQDTEKLKGFVRRFDLDGMEEYSGPLLTGKDMRKFIPKL